MYQLIMTVILIATFAAVAVMGVNVMKPSALTRITDVEIAVSEQLRLSLAIQSYRRANGTLPDANGWLGAIDPYLNADPRVMPEGLSLAYLRIGEEFALCARGANAWSSDSLKTVSCTSLPERFQKIPQVLVATPGRTYVAPGELPHGGLFVEISPLRIQLRNEGSSSLNISAISFTTGTHFAIEATTCITELDPGALCVVDYSFTSDASGAGEDTMTILSNSI